MTKLKTRADYLDAEVEYERKRAKGLTIFTVASGLAFSGLIYGIKTSLDSYDDQQKERAAHFTSQDKKIARKVCQSLRPPEEEDECYRDILENGYRSNRGILTIVFGAALIEVLGAAYLTHRQINYAQRVEKWRNDGANGPRPS